MTIASYPLLWPVGWKRTEPHRRRTSVYKVQFARARDEVLRELGLMSGTHRPSIVISSNIPVRRDGLPYADMREPADPGIAVYWDERKAWNAAKQSYDIEPRVIACDTWKTTRENIRAIGLAIGALRMLERTGASEILDRAFTGFAALPPASTQPREWWITLGFDAPPASMDVVEAAYRERAKRAHPDAGGTHEAMVALNAARELARWHFRTVPA
jgi:hypothetical protein